MSACGSSIRGTLDQDFDDLDELPDDPFELQVEKLYEKRATTREDGLQKLIVLFTQEWQFEECAFRQDTFAQLFLNCLRRGAPSEAALAARALGLHVITLGASDASEAIFRDARAVLEPLLLTSKSTATKGAAVDALSMMCFVASEGPHETLEIINLLLRAIQKGVASVQAPSLRSLSLLLTTVPAGQLNASFVEAQLSMLTALLHSDNLEVRAAAGEAIALLYGMCNLSELPDPDSNSSSAQEDEVVIGNGVHPAALEDIVDRMKDLATNRGDAIRRSKKDRASQKGTFRELMSIVEQGSVGPQRIKLGGDILVIDSLPDTIRLNAFRRYLATGFQAHLQMNPLLHEVFNFRPSSEPVERLSTREKRLYRSQTSAESKGRSLTRKKERKAMSAYKMASLHDQ